MDHNAVLEAVDEDFLSESHKYVDDLTTTESIAPTAVGYEHQDEIGGVVTDVYHAPMSELNLNTLTNYCEGTGLKVNESKTQLLAISNNKNPVKVWIQAGKESIQSSETLKLLGSVFSDRPDVSAQVERQPQTDPEYPLKLARQLLALQDALPNPSPPPALF